MERLKILLDAPHVEGPYKIDSETSPLSVQVDTGNIFNLLETRLGPYFRCLIHLDEPNNMIKSEDGYETIRRRFY